MAGSGLEVTPLFETLADLAAAPAIVDRALTERAWLRAPRAATVMVGYSDAAKDAGFLTAQWAIHEAQRQIADVARRQGAEIVIFHGRGGSTGRGGGADLRRDPGPAARAVRPAGQITDQGETIAFKYLLPGLALRNLEAASAATLLSAFPGVAGSAPSAEGADLMEELAGIAHAHYRELIDDPGFVPFFEAFTPVSELALLQLGSRPARRPARPASSRCGRSRGCSRGRRPACRCPPGTASARRSPAGSTGRPTCVCCAPVPRLAVLPDAGRGGRDVAREVEHAGGGRRTSTWCRAGADATGCGSGSTTSTTAPSMRC